MERQLHALLALLSFICVTSAAPAAEAGPSSLLGRRSLLAESSSNAASAPCGAATDKLLTNGYFNPKNLGSMQNLLLMATMSNDVYPWSPQYGIGMLDVADGLSKQQDENFQRIFVDKYTKLGATSIQFVQYYEAGLDGAAGHAVVMTTPRDVFVVIRGTADMGQAKITGRFETYPWKVYGANIELYYPAAKSMSGLFPKIQAAVKRAVAATENPGAATLYLTGHSLGAASACLAALMLNEQGYKIGGVWAFDPYKIGKDCGPKQKCWVSLYEQHLSDITWAIWNNQDPIPQLLDAHFKTNMTKAKWGHVPRNKHWIRIVGNKCLPASGTRLMEACPPEIDTADGLADGVCPGLFGDHMPWVIQQRIAYCALLQDQNESRRGGRVIEALRMDACSTNSVWTALLGLPPPGK